MKFLIDNADINEIKRLYEYYPLDGVTTNPSILAAAKRHPYEVLEEIRDFIQTKGDNQELHVQALSTKAEDIVEEAHKITERLRGNTFVKIPTVPEGLKAMQILKKEGGIKLTATAVYTPVQAYLAAKCGVDYAAPYINRIDNLSYDGLADAKMIQDLFKIYGFKTEVLAASFQNTHQVLSMCKYGVGAVTVSPKIIDKLIDSRDIDAAVQVFRKDFESLCGEGKTMINA